MSCPLTAHCYPTSWKGAESVPAPRRGAHGALGGSGGAFLSMLSVDVCDSSPPTNLLGWWLAVVPGHRAGGVTPGAAAAQWMWARGTKDQKGAPHLPEEQHAPWKPSPSTKSLSPAGQCTKQPCKRTGILLSHETLDDPTALMAWGRKDAWDKVWTGLRSSQKWFSLQVWVTLLIHSGLHVLGCCKEHV